MERHWRGGASGNGTVFAVEKDGTHFRTLHSFATAFNGQIGAFGLPLRVNSDGASPQAKLILSGNTLYGTTFYGGSWGAGTVFAVKTDGTRFTTLHTFTTIDNAYANSDGAAPLAGLVLSGSTLYGEAIIGGQWGKGTLFSLSIPRPLTISCKPHLPLECTNGGSRGTVTVELEASGSVPVVLVWTIDGTPYQTNTVPAGEVSISTNLTFTADFALGEHLVTVSASNEEITPATCSTTVQVRDTTPPQILSVSATPNLLWPPNQQMVSVTIEVQATDNCGPTTSKIVGVTSNEATRSFGRNNGPDWLISGDLNVDLRAERLGNAEERIYAILIECNDVAGNSSFGLVTVGVPHNRGQP